MKKELILEIFDPLKVSLKNDIFPAIKKGLSEDGYFVLRPIFLLENENLDDDVIEEYVTSIMLMCSECFSDKVGFHKLTGGGSESSLGFHIEGIYLKDGVYPSFALGCIKTADSGGNTVLYDCVKSAEDLIKEIPDIEKTSLVYSSRSYKDEEKEYKIIHENDYGKVLFFNSLNKEENWKNVPKNYSIKDISETIEKIVKSNVLLNHSWVKGDMLFINNKKVLHDRESYRGLRKMMRVRYDDINNCKVLL